MSGADERLAKDHAALKQAVKAAGAAVLQFYEEDRTVKSWMKGDASPVSEADHAANDILEDALRGHAPAYGWLSEETDVKAGCYAAERTWVVDPLDGTRAFLKGNPHFSVCAALVEQGVPVAAAIYNPVMDAMYEASLGGGARCNAAPLAASTAHALDGARLLGQPRMYTHPDWPEPWGDVDVKWVSSTALRMAMVAAGRAEGAVVLTPRHDWDIAAGDLIAREAGGRVSDHLGRPFRFNAEPPRQRSLVCAAPGLYDEILRRLAHLSNL